MNAAYGLMIAIMSFVVGAICSYLASKTSNVGVKSGLGTVATVAFIFGSIWLVGGVFIEYAGD
jgi:MFS-type transporter involved in bile tolerance (Atg22 family)